MHVDKKNPFELYEAENAKAQATSEADLAAAEDPAPRPRLPPNGLITRRTGVI